MEEIAMEEIDMKVRLVIIIVCVALSAFFSATETAFSCLNRIRIKNLSEKGNSRATLVMKLINDYDTLLSTILIGNNIVNILCSSISTLLFVSLLGEANGASVATIVVTLVVLIFGEITPKSLAKEFPESIALTVAPFINLLRLIFTPANIIFAGWKKFVSLFVHKGNTESITDEELKTIIVEATEDGGIEKHESELLKNAIEFNELTAWDIMTPRVDVVGIDIDATPEEVRDTFIKSGHSRLLVFGEHTDDIEGILYQKDYYVNQDIKSVMRDPLVVNEATQIDKLLRILQKKKQQIALVVDEYGGLSGLITLEDIIEELVGEIWDEHDRLPKDIIKLSDKEYIVYGKSDIERVFEALGNAEESFNCHTVNGWIIDKLERLAKTGDVVRYENMKVEVLEASEKTVLKAKITLK